MKHKWHKEIKAWADGAEIEFRYVRTDNEWSIWVEADKPLWDTTGEVEYRIKPQPKEPHYLYVYLEPETGDYKFNRSCVKIYEKFYIGKIKLEVNDD
jgi:hypothetical protein